MMSYANKFYSTFSILQFSHVGSGTDCIMSSVNRIKVKWLASCFNLSIIMYEKKNKIKIKKEKHRGRGRDVGKFMNKLIYDRICTRWKNQGRAGTVRSIQGRIWMSYSEGQNM